MFEFFFFFFFYLLIYLATVKQDTQTSEKAFQFAHLHNKLSSSVKQKRKKKLFQWNTHNYVYST